MGEVTTISNTDHDGIYHQLYQHPLMLEDLVRQFVTEPWVADLDFSRMEPVKTKYQVPEMPKRESDMVWRIPLRSGGAIYLLLLLEFQSKVERWMVLRIIIYLCLLWLELLYEKQIPAGGPLPPVFPAVLYNGDTPWLMPIRLRELIGLPDDSPLWPFQPDGQFFLIDEGRYKKDDLDQRDSLSALVFKIEQCQDPEDLPALIDEVVAWFDRYPEFEELKTVLAHMFQNAIAAMTGDKVDDAKASLGLLEAKSMLQTNMERWRNEKQREWSRDGEIKGERQGGANFLLRLLRRRFPTLPSWVEQKVLDANLDALAEWTDR
ncbi:MAG: Rpn family recombination-promoting nuclease/putative transposase, partial [Magnetococcales bacterium]|nr:Rpn family recombination-promoting nuclease/putative transposase [Magnetococcales bacterium]